MKPCNNSYLKATIRKGLEKKRLSHELQSRTLQLERSSAELSKRTDQLSTLHEISANLQSFQDEEELLHHIVDGIHSHLGYQKVLIGLLSEDGRSVQWRKGIDSSRWLFAQLWCSGQRVMRLSGELSPESR